MSVGESAVPCHHPLSPAVPYERFPSPSFGCACFAFVVGGWVVKLDHSALRVVHESLLLFPYPLLCHSPCSLATPPDY